MAMKLGKQPQLLAEMTYMLSHLHTLKWKSKPEKITKNLHKPSLCRGMTANFDYECFPKLGSFQRNASEEFLLEAFLLDSVQK